VDVPVDGLIDRSITKKEMSISIDDWEFEMFDFVQLHYVLYTSVICYCYFGLSHVAGLLYGLSYFVQLFVTLWSQDNNNSSRSLVRHHWILAINWIVRVAAIVSLLLLQQQQQQHVSIYAVGWIAIVDCIFFIAVLTTHDTHQ
jgi:hypothetical protein